MKKLIALVLALALVLAVAVASATTITINKNTSANTDVNVDNTTYTAYKILDAEYATNSTTSAGAGDGRVSYTISTNSKWYTAVSACSYFTLTDIAGDSTHKTVTLATGTENTAATAEAIGNVLKAYIDGSMTGAVATDTTDNDEENGIAITAGTAASVSKGYYLIKSSNGVKLVVATTDITMTEKNTYITDDKVVFKNNYNIGDDVTYFITVNLPADIDTTQDVIVHDNMDDVLKFNDDTVVYVSDSTVADPKTIASTSFGALDSTIYTVSKPVSPAPALTDNCDFEITIKPATLRGKTIVFKFTAKLLDTANADTEIQNSEWSSHAGYTTKPSTPKVKTFDIDLKKVFTGLAAGNTIDNNYAATFELNQGNNASIKFTASGSNYTKVDGEVADEGSETLTVHHNETINIKGLAAGSYTLTEKTTTNGYNKLPAPIQITVADDGTYTATMNNTSVLTTSGNISIIEVENNSGTELPSTGGIGTTIFYVLGGLLVVGAAVILVARRKASN